MENKIGENCYISPLANLYGCEIGDNTKIGAFVEIQENATVGKNCKVSSHSFVCDGVTIEDNVFIGHGVVFINDKNPRATNGSGDIESKDDWRSRFVTTRICHGASIGSNATIMGGVTVGMFSVVGAGAVVTKDVPAGQTWVGNPAKRIVAERPEYAIRQSRNAQEAIDLE